MGELSGGLDIEDVDPPTRKKGSVKFRNSQSRDQNYVWRNFKQTSKSTVFKKVATKNVWICELTNISDKKISYFVRV